MPRNVLARCLRRRKIKIATIAAIAGTPTPMPTPRPIFSPVLEEEESPAAEEEAVGAEVFDAEDVVTELDDTTDGVDDVVDVDDVDDVLLVILIVLELETPIVAANTTRLFIAQHCSEVKLDPQHQVPSIEHCDIAIFWLADPPVYIDDQPMVLHHLKFSAYRRICAYSP
jgi:hypothetical protein